MMNVVNPLRVVKVVLLVELDPLLQKMRPRLNTKPRVKTIPHLKRTEKGKLEIMVLQGKSDTDLVWNYLEGSLSKSNKRR